jgi:3-oxoadipate enol-lactonase
MMIDARKEESNLLQRSSTENLVLLHGTSGFSEDWSGVIERLENDTRVVIRPDYLNLKNMDSAVDGVTVAEAAARALVATKAMAEGPFDLVGYSLGASVAAFIAAEYPESVRSLVLISGFGHGNDVRMKLQFELWLDLARTNAKALTRLLLLTGFSRGFLSNFDEKTIAGIVDAFAASSDWETIAQSIRLDLDLDIRKQAKKIAAPTLMIIGKHDQIVPEFYSHELTDLIPGAQRTEIDAGHLAFLEQPALLAGRISTFLDSLRVSRDGPMG